MAYYRSRGEETRRHERTEKNMDATTFEALYTATAPGMVRYVARSFASVDAEAIVADAFVKIWRLRETIADTNLNGLVQTTVKRLAIDALRTSKPTESIFSEDGDADNESVYRFEPAAPSDHNPAAGTLARILEVLTPDQRIVLVMRNQGHPFRDIAVKTGRSEDACKKLYNRAKAQVQKRRAELVA
jgi:RNA polymerase sigma factor (sigma-70 family)